MEDKTISVEELNKVLDSWIIDCKTQADIFRKVNMEAAKEIGYTLQNQRR